MCPVLAIFRYGDFKEAVEIAKANLEVEGKGHSVAIHSHNRDNIEYAGEQINVSRFVINQTCATSAGGRYFNGLAPTNTLGCGSWGHNSISESDLQTLDQHIADCLLQTRQPRTHTGRVVVHFRLNNMEREIS